MAVTGARLAWAAETDRYAAAVLARHWPDVPNLGDITALDWAAVPPVDLVSRRMAVPGHLLRRPRSRHHGRNPQWPLAPHRRRPSPPTTQLRLPGERRRAPHAGPRRKSSPTWPRSGMTRNGCAYALPTPEPRTAATACSSSPSGPARRTARGCCRPRSPGTPATGRPCRPGRPAGTGRSSPAVTATGPAPRCRPRSPCCRPRSPATSARTRHGRPGTRPSGAKRQTGLPDVIIHRLAGRAASRDGNAAGPAAADPGHRLLAQGARPARRPARQRPPERPGLDIDGRRPRRGPDRQARAPEPRGRRAIRRWEGCPGLSRAPPPAQPAGRPAGPGRAAAVRRVDDGHGPGTASTGGAARRAGPHRCPSNGSRPLPRRGKGRAPAAPALVPRARGYPPRLTWAGSAGTRTAPTRPPRSRRPAGGRRRPRRAAPVPSARPSRR